jgi:1-deoxy-D-xylulose-5-phosphate reductoisomerase
MLAGFNKHSNPNKISKKRLVILGSTGSIGSSALEVIESNSDCFELEALVAGSNVVKLATQARKFRPQKVVCADASKYQELKGLLTGDFQGEILAGPEAINDLVVEPQVDLVLAAIVGVAGLLPVYHALKANKVVALANKESLVSAGEIIKALLNSGTGKIIPVDSEHSAIFQALQGECYDDLKNVILTASGGPFLNKPKCEFAGVTPEQALKHPNWNMGSKITIDSATMMNKALELIEAYWLFGEDLAKIEVIMHPQSIVHSLVELCDGSQIAQLSVPDMKGAIAYGLTYPYGRLSNVMTKLDLAKLQRLEFFEVDSAKFPGLGMAKQAIKSGGAACAVFNLANEIAVGLFLEKKLRFDQIFDFVSQALELPAFPVLEIANISQQLEQIELVLMENIKLGN